MTIFFKLPPNSGHLSMTDKLFKTRRCPLFRGSNCISYPLVHIWTWAYQGVRKFSENFRYILRGWLLMCQSENKLFEDIVQSIQTRGCLLHRDFVIECVSKIIWSFVRYSLIVERELILCSTVLKRSSRWASNFNLLSRKSPSVSDKIDFIKIKLIQWSQKQP